MNVANMTGTVRAGQVTMDCNAIKHAPPDSGEVTVYTHVLQDVKMCVTPMTVVVRAKQDTMEINAILLVPKIV